MIKNENESQNICHCPCYNQARFLDESLQSIQDQTYENWECIIVDDGSPDNTAETADKWVKKIAVLNIFTKKTEVYLLQEMLLWKSQPEIIFSFRCR